MKQLPTFPTKDWLCKCSRFNEGRKRCSNCMRWRTTSEVVGGSIVSAEGSVAVTVAGGVASGTCAEGEGGKNEGMNGGERPEVESSRVLSMKNKVGSIGGGGRASQVKHKKRDKSFPYHRVSLEDAASLGCDKCKKELETGQKTHRSHDVGCPRGRQSRTCPIRETGGTPTISVAGGANHSANDFLEDGDPPWRTEGNAWIGRRVQYNPEAMTEETRACSKNKFYDALGVYEQQQSPSFPSSAVKGTIVGFISERDKDSEGNPGFVSSRDGKPAMLFHVVFDKGNALLLLNKDFEEWEIKEHCTWVNEESDDEDGGVEDDVKVEVSNDGKEIQPKQLKEETNVLNRTKTHPDPETSAASNKQSSKKVTLSQGSQVNGNKDESEDTVADDDDPIAPSYNSSFLTRNTREKDSNSNDNKRIQKEEILVNCPENAAQKSVSLNLSECSSFNEALKSALSTYVSNSTMKTSNNPPPPMPPPFLSHQEESTLRTALAFAMIKARNKKKEGGADSSVASRPHNNIVAQTHTSSFDHTGLGRTGGLMRLPGNQNERRDGSLFGGLLSLRQRQCTRSQHFNTTTNAMLVFYREMNHIRDILKVAMSSILPLYRGALDANDESSNREVGNENSQVEGHEEDSSNKKKGHPKRLPSAVYDFDAGYNSLSAGNTSQKTTVDCHYASLDGLCQHAIARLSRLVRDAGLKSKIEQRVKRKRFSASKDDASEKPARSDLSGTCGDASSANSHQAEEKSIECRNIARDAVVELFYEDLIGKAYRQNPAHGDLETSSSKKTRVEKIMAACHVIHRLLYLDQSCCFASEGVIAVSRTLGDLYNNDYASECTSDTDVDISMENKVAQPASKGKVQVVSPNWGTSRAAYSNDRNERRSRGIDVMFRNIRALPGIKRKNEAIGDDKASDSQLLPSVPDVLAVNLLRLLECASAIRLHHSSKRISRQQRDYQQQSIPNSESFAATQILTEIRSTTAVELTMPVHMDDAATFYFRESLAMRAANHNKTTMLRPCAKLMLRVHFFSLVKKLSSYEQV